MKRIFSIPLLFLWLIFSSSAWAMPYSAMYVLGDSLSDQGNFYLASGGTIPPPEYNDGVHYGRFTNGLNYIDHMAAHLGLSSDPVLRGGTNFALGGARTYYHFDPSGWSLSDQLGMLGSGNADSDALYVVWAGANDVFDILSPIPPPGITPNIASSVDALAGVVENLASRGAESILVPNVPDLGLTPRAMALSANAPNPVATVVSAQFNQALELELISLEATYPETRFIRFDTFGFLNEVFYNPDPYGFINVNDACYSAFVLPGGTTCVNPEAFLSWDGFHPTSAAHEILGARMAAAVVPEPNAFFLLSTGTLVLAARFRRRSSDC